MKKQRGFRLGRNLIRVWRLVSSNTNVLRHSRLRRHRFSSYVQLEPSSPPPPPTKRSQKPPKPSVAGKVRTWSRAISQRLASFRGGKKRLPPNIDHTCKPPKGHLVVYVGGEDPCRFLVPVVYINHPLFCELLREAEEANGFHHPGGITIPCPISDFEKVRTRVEASSDSVRWGKRRWSERRHFLSLL